MSKPAHLIAFLWVDLLLLAWGLWEFRSVSRRTDGEGGPAASPGDAGHPDGEDGPHER